MEMSPFQKGSLQPKTFVYKWKIQRFFADCGKLGDFYTSPVFSIQCLDMVTKWHLKIYPRGKTEVSEGRVTLGLYYESEIGSKVIVDYQITILSKHNRLSKRFKASTFNGPTGNWCSVYVASDSLKSKENGALIDDTLTILCEMTFPEMPQSNTEIFQGYDELSDNIGKGLENYERLLEDSYFSDVTFNIQDKQLHLHKAILMCRNPVFKAMFEHEMKEKKESSVDITDVDYKVMKELIRFIYSGKVENIEEIANDLLIAADKYAVTELKALCERQLYYNLKIDNAVEYLNLTEMCNTIHLKSLVIKFAATHHKEIAKMPGFAELNSHVMHQIILSIPEND